jgi:type IV pilus assembly protein PilX
MRSKLHKWAAPQQGMALITSLLLLLVVTILAVSMFRSFGIEGKIAGNVREKQRALMAAEDAQQFAEWWLSKGNAATLGGGTCSQMLDGNAGETQVCKNSLSDFMTAAGTTVANASQWPYWVTYKPTSLKVQANTLGNYAQLPGFYISSLGKVGNNMLFQVDAVGYGADAKTVSVVESTYEVSQGPQGVDGSPEFPPAIEVSQK